MNKTIVSVRNFRDHLSGKRRKQFLYIVVLMLISSFAEVLSLGAILPFLGAISDPGFIYNHEYMQAVVRVFNLTHKEQIVLPMTLVFIGAVLFAGFVRILLLYVMTRFAYAVGSDIGFKVYNRTLYQSYDTHMSRNSSEIINSIVRKVDDVVGGVVTPSLLLISSAILLVGILTALFLIHLLAALISAIGFGFLYWLITVKSRRHLAINSRKIANESTKVVKSLQEGLGGIRDVLLDGNQQYYCNIFRKSDLSLRLAQGNNSIVSGAPRFLMEAVGMVLIAVLAYSLTLSDEGIGSVMPVLGALALGAQRMLPALQQVYASVSTIRGAQSSLDDVVELLNQPIPKYTNKSHSDKITFHNSIILDKVSFRYPNENTDTLKNITLKIDKGLSIGIIGQTGSGKSTLFDILMGLLSPTTGTISVDGVVVSDNNIQAWRECIAHVPQHVFIADKTIAENIAFGCTEEEIDFDRVRRSAEQAQLSKFIEGMDCQYRTKVGERGVKLSGGQWQRIGIARALYKKADIIVFDEATSALDNETEFEIMNTINKLKSDLTILMIAHRLTTLKGCDKIVKIENGNVKSVGTYNEIILKENI